MPESPRYFVASGRPDKAEHILKSIALTNKRPLPSGKLHDVHAEVSYKSLKKIFYISPSKSLG